jgi:ubiquinol-cytochrome c reductase cytochrome c subunit
MSEVPADRRGCHGHYRVQHVERVTDRRSGEREEESGDSGGTRRRELGEDRDVEQAVRGRPANGGRDGHSEKGEPGRDGGPRQGDVDRDHRSHGSASGLADGAPMRATTRSIAGWVAAAALGGALLFVAATASPFPTAGAIAEPSGQVRDNAATIYLQNCASCHGPQGEGTAVGPPLTGVGEAAVDFYLRTGRMPLGEPGQQPRRQKPVFDDAQIRALVEYVGSWGDGPEIPQVGTTGDVRRGWELYTANCAACHAATGAGNAVGGGSVAVGLGQATDVEIAEATLVGPGVMPKFSFDPADRDAIIAYVRYLRSTPSPGGAPIGGFGAVAEGFVAVAIGLTGVVLIARFVGRRSRNEEPDLPAEETR